MGLRSYVATAPPTTLDGTIAIGATSLTLADGTGYPTTDFVITLERTGVKEEKILVGTRSGNSCQDLERGFDNTTPIDHASGVSVEHTLSATDLAEANRHIWDPAQAEIDHGNFLTASRHAAILHSSSMYGPASVLNSHLAGSIEADKFLGARGRVAYKEWTSFNDGLTTELDIPSGVVVATLRAGRQYRVSAYLHVRQQTARSLCFSNIKVGTTVHATDRSVNEAGDRDVLKPVGFLNGPPSGATTFQLTAGTTSGTLQLNQASGDKSHLLVEDIGPWP